MMRTTTDEAAPAMRDQRDELERLQAELRHLRAARTTLPTRLAAEEASLQAALDAATARSQAAQAELDAMETERADLEARLAKWRAQREARQKDEQVLALGATRRHKYLEWWSFQEKEWQPSPPWQDHLAMFVFGLMAGFALAAHLFR